MDEKKLKELLHDHGLWLKEKGGKRLELEYADLRDADLEHADLRYASLREADLRYACLGDADLRYADFWGANFRYANLRYADLRCAEFGGADFSSADLNYANLRDVDFRKVSFRDAVLEHADLYGASLEGANLRYTNLAYADLRNANLCGVNLCGAFLDKARIGYWEFGEVSWAFPGLYILKMQPPETRLRAWKYLVDGKSPYFDFHYEVGKAYAVKDYSADERLSCAEGFNVATLQWCFEDIDGALANEFEFIEVEFCVKDIVAIPFASDGKFRVKRLKVIRKLTREQAKREVLKYLEVAALKTKGEKDEN